MTSSLDIASEKARALQNAEVLADGRPGHLEWARKLADCGGASGQPVEQGPTGSVAERAEHKIEVLVLGRFGSAGR